MTSARLGGLVKFLGDVLAAAAVALREYQAVTAAALDVEDQALEDRAPDAPVPAEPPYDPADPGRAIPPWPWPWTGPERMGPRVMRLVLARGHKGPVTRRELAAEWEAATSYVGGALRVAAWSPHLAWRVATGEHPLTDAIQWERRSRPPVSTPLTRQLSCFR